MKLFSFPILLGLAQFALAKPFLKRWNDIAEKHAWAEIPRGWEYESPAPPDYKFNLRIGLKQDRIDDLIAHLTEISDPSHPRYGQHLTVAESEALVAAHPESVQVVDSWLEHHGVSPEAVTRHSGGGEWVTITVSVAQAERMLGTKYNVYNHGSESEKVVRTMSYSLPRELHPHISVVTPTTYFGTVRSMRATHFLQPDAKPVPADLVAPEIDSVNGVPPTTCNTNITPSCLRTLYNTANYVVRGGSNNTLGVTGYLGEYANTADLQTFFSKYRADAAGSSFSVVQVNGGSNDQSKPGIEANLDIQYTTGLAYPIPAVFWSTGGSPPFNPDSFTPSNTNEPYLDWLSHIFSQPNIPHVITTSYGDDEQSVPKDYANTVCNLFAQLGSVGTTALFSSGDEGVGGGDCKTNDGTNKAVFQPAFPASCPYVTTVGGTTRTNPEVAVSFSGGGFSRYFSRPSYQDAAVSNYVTSLGTKYAGLYNPSGRAYPDLAAQAQNFQVVVGGFVQPVGGTSCSSPAVAGVLSLLNDYRLSQGKPSLGFINPLIYSTASTAFNDIVSGSNPGCGTNGFSAAAGWDPVTGLGTPDFVKLQAVV